MRSSACGTPSTPHALSLTGQIQTGQELSVVIARGGLGHSGCRAPLFAACVRGTAPDGRYNGCESRTRLVCIGLV